ncbi:hypothetical protein SAMN05428982_0252 [Pseudoxanthomonas sp. CF385]|uniref:hypothetical protein n=1 Tax=Pseudoxanthomonas sp. CF385 TaxID=1881042 RepID=UPI00088CC8E4|nr:hypothetical protein [Pseudoxanthomonas sp. CF385]SDQ24345.1 hypothetical protein SAMN05428982_0252 [Pseudoxanthomonas sp. CF385]
MRKAGKMSVWLAVMATMWVSSSAMAQEGPRPVPPGRIESDPRLARAAEAWHRAWRANVEDHLRAVAARGTPRDLLAAGWLWPMETDEATLAARGSLSRPQARAWIQAAYDDARGDDPLVDWVLLDACATSGAACDRQRLLARVIAGDPGNAETLLLAYQDAVERKDAVAAEAYWQSAGRASHYRSRINEVGALMASVLHASPSPELDPTLAAAMGEDLGLGRSATSKDLGDVVVMALNVAIALPALQPLQQRCTARVGRVPAEARRVCKQIYALLAADGSTLIGPSFALPRLVEWADGEDERAAARERLRRFAWIYEAGLRQYLLPANARRLPVDHMERMFRDGELAAMRYQLQLNGIATEPPAGWLPDNPEYRALLTGASVPVAR